MAGLFHLCLCLVSIIKKSNRFLKYIMEFWFYHTIRANRSNRLGEEENKTTQATAFCFCMLSSKLNWSQLGLIIKYNRTLYNLRRQFFFLLHASSTNDRKLYVESELVVDVRSGKYWNESCHKEINIKRNAINHISSDLECFNWVVQAIRIPIVRK